MNLDEIWKHQAIPSKLAEALDAVAHAARKHIINSPGGRNITGWCKKDECWLAFQDEKIALPKGWEIELADEPMEMAGSITTDFVAARFLLTPGRTYEQAVSGFSPYRDTQAVDPAGREAGRAIIGKAKGNKRPSFIYVNNRLEGNALKTIGAMLEIPGAA